MNVMASELNYKISRNGCNEIKTRSEIDETFDYEHKLNHEALYQNLHCRRPSLKYPGGNNSQVEGLKFGGVDPIGAAAPFTGAIASRSACTCASRGAAI